MSNKARRANVNDTVKMSLLCEVNGTCPQCRRVLVAKKADKNVRVFDVAHIYPLNPTPHELEILKNEKLLSDDIDSEENFIVLCKECHKIYDTNKTVEEYRSLVKIKENINREKEISEIWGDQTLLKDISIVADKIGKLDKQSIKATELSYDALDVSEKVNDTFGYANEGKVDGFVIRYFIPIKNELKRLEKINSGISQMICQQVKFYYLILYNKKMNQNERFEKMIEWFMINTGINDRVKSEVLVSYFIQNCEIFSNDNAQ